MNATERARLEELGYEGVLSEIARGVFGQPDSPLRNKVDDWLRLKAIEREYASSAKRDAREEETLAIAKDALCEAKSARKAAESAASAARAQARWAMWAAIIATIAIVTAMKDQILVLIFAIS